jgi:hypothetical protein
MHIAAIEFLRFAQLIVYIYIQVKLSFLSHALIVSHATKQFDTTA